MRLLAALCAALIAVFALFWVMQFLVLSGADRDADIERYRAVDFVRAERQEQPETRRRSRPDPPEPPERPPPPPDVQVQAEQPPAPDMQAFEIPRLALSADIGGGPFVGGFRAGDAATGDSELVPLVRLTPRYPRNAARDGVEGEVRLEVTVRPDGTVKEARVIEASPRGYFEAAAVSAALRGRFRPRTVGGEPVESTGQYTMIFRLE